MRILNLGWYVSEFQKADTKPKRALLWIKSRPLWAWIELLQAYYAFRSKKKTKRPSP